MRYSLLLTAPEAKDVEISPESMAEFQTLFQNYGADLESAGVLISADILQPSEVTTTVSVRDGSVQVQDGPFADTREKLAGAFVVEVPDLDAAISWAAKCPGAQYGWVEVRPAELVFSEGSWHQAK